MKKLLIAMTMMIATVGNANAFEFDFNEHVMTEMVVTTVIKTVMGDKKQVKIGNGGVIIDTVGVIGKGKMTKCWTSQIYKSDGTVINQVQCH
jgi:hypothetical protein